MIRAKKGTAPAVLSAAVVTTARLDLEARYDADPAACRTPGNHRLNVPATLYNDKAVKRKLIADQNEKCCYCEARFQHVGYGDVEHYRPKNGFRQPPGAALEKPGYYWLAYDWDNLLFSCKRCNIGHKRNAFPLANHPGGRAYSHHDALTLEQPLLLHPVHDSPALHIAFRGAVAVGISARGTATIDICGLNRKDALERRRTHIANLESHELMAAKDPSTMSPADLAREIAQCGSALEFARRILQAKAIHKTAALNAAEYAGMVRAKFPHLPQR